MCTTLRQLCSMEFTQIYYMAGVPLRLVNTVTHSLVVKSQMIWIYL